MNYAHFHVSAIALLCLCAASASASDPRPAPLDIQLAGEIIVAPKAVSNTHSQAAEQLDRARAYRNDQPPAGPTIIIVPEDEQGVLSPRPGTGLPSNARINQLKARKNQQDGLGTSPAAVLIESSDNDSSARGRAKDNRLKANSYSKGDLDSILTGKVGTDGIPLVVCKGFNNQAGRIGDDVESGSVFSIMQNNRPIKVRCE